MIEIGIIIDCCLVLPFVDTVLFLIVDVVVPVPLVVFVIIIVTSVVSPACPLAKLNNIQTMKRITILKEIV
jgi:hypothetical protein